mmetsp:Transcript_125176/g.249913  ORF Transcript_125176/g.249913 Transcript_125176/m.249913 type:complete len:497 (-) Transcript_125176:140-1630(-)
MMQHDLAMRVSCSEDEVSKPSTLSLGVLCAALSLHTAILTVGAWAGSICLAPWNLHSESFLLRQLRERNDELAAEHARVQRKLEWARSDSEWLQQDIENLKSRVASEPGRGDPNGSHPYEVITASRGHARPEMYSMVPEKTIWSYWFHKEHCTSSTNCTLPAHVQLCMETVIKNKGSFSYKLLHIDEVEQYVSMYDLPFQWPVLSPQHQKDSLMNALLARYGGVTLDPATILFRPLDDYWNEMVAGGATFLGYMFRLNGQPWRHAESVPYWFLMSRREGIFSSVVRSQVIGAGDRSDASSDYPMWHNAFGDQTLVPLLSIFNYSLPKCIDDSSVGFMPSRLHGDLRRYCPESRGPEWWRALSGPARNDTRIFLRDPRDGPLLPFAWIDMEMWNVSGAKLPTERARHGFLWDRTSGAPLQGVSCTTQKECWEKHVASRYFAHHHAGEAPLMNFVHLEGQAIKLRSFKEIFSHSDSYFYHWLRWAGLDMSKIEKETTK